MEFELEGCFQEGARQRLDSFPSFIEAAISLCNKHSFRETGRIIRGYYPNRDDAVEMLRAS
jgi:hypothetical protein